MIEDRLSLEEVRQDPPDPLCDCHTCQAARTIVACGDVLDTLESRAADDRKTAEEMTWASPGAAGRAHAYTEAAKLIREALDAKDTE